MDNDPAKHLAKKTFLVTMFGTAVVIGVTYFWVILGTP